MYNYIWDYTVCMRYHRTIASTNVSWLLCRTSPRSKVSRDCAIEELDHHSEQVSSEGGIPTVLGGLISYECMLRLHFYELYIQVIVDISKIESWIRNRSRWDKGEVFTEDATLWSSSVLRMRSRPARGTCVS